ALGRRHEKDFCRHSRVKRQDIINKYIFMPDSYTNRYTFHEANQQQLVRPGTLEEPPHTSAGGTGRYRKSQPRSHRSWHIPTGNIEAAQGIGRWPRGRAVRAPRPWGRADAIWRGYDPPRQTPAEYP